MEEAQVHVQAPPPRPERIRYVHRPPRPSPRSSPDAFVQRVTPAQGGMAVRLLARQSCAPSACRRGASRQCRAHANPSLRFWVRPRPPSTDNVRGKAASTSHSHSICSSLAASHSLYSTSMMTAVSRANERRGAPVPCTPDRWERARRSALDVAGVCQAAARYALRCEMRHRLRWRASPQVAMRSPGHQPWAGHAFHRRVPSRGLRFSIAWPRLFFPVTIASQYLFGLGG